MNKLKHITASIARTLLGLTFLFSGFVKAVDPLGTTYKIEDYLKAFGGFFNNLLPMAEAAAIALIVFEFMLGVCLLLNIRTSVTSWLALAMMLFMTPLTLYIALTNPVSDCGCFGDAIVLSNWATFWKNIVLLALVILLLCWKRYIPQTFTGWAEALLTCIALAAVGVFMFYNLSHLPVIDFRPYKIGNNIPSLMEMPEGAPADIYRTTFIYEKDGKRQKFTLEDYPRGDSTWTFVEKKSVLIQKGYEPPVHDFEIVNMAEQEDITEDILEADAATLVVMYDLRKADLKQTDKLISLALAEQAEGHLFYILTGSGTDDVEEFLLSQVQPRCDGEAFDLVEASICSTDPVTLKTIVRANPGVIVLSSGVVVDKYNLANREIARTEVATADDEDEDYTIEVYEDDDDTSVTEDYSDSDVYTDEQEFE